MPFGLKPAPRIFTKAVTLLVNKWRSEGSRILVYLDDWLFFVQPNELEAVRARVLRDCRLAHFAVNTEKSSLEGLPTLTHLGVIVDLANNKFAVPPHKRDQILSDIEDILSTRKCSARTLAKVVGRIAALKLPIGPLTVLFANPSIERSTQLRARTSSFSSVLTLWRSYSSGKLPRGKRSAPRSGPNPCGPRRCRHGARAPGSRSPRSAR